MAFKKIPVVAAKVAGSESNFPVYIKPSAMTGWGALTLAEAESIRFYSDEAKTTELAREVVSADEIHVKVPSLTTTTEIYADYDGIRADYAVTDTYGRNAVWGGKRGKWHNGQTDSTSASNNGVASGGVAGGNIVGKLGDGIRFDGSNDKMDFGDKTDFEFASGQSFAITMWRRNFSGDEPTSSSPGLLSKGYDTDISQTPWYLTRTLGSGAFEFLLRNSSNTTSRTSSGDSYYDGNWHHWVNVYDASANELRMYIDAVLVDTVTGVATGAYGTNSGEFVLGVHVNDRYGEFDLDELGMQASIPSANWITTEYNNQNDVASFWGTVEDAGAPVVDRSGYLVWL